MHEADFVIRGVLGVYLWSCLKYDSIHLYSRRIPLIKALGSPLKQATYHTTHKAVIFIATHGRRFYHETYTWNVERCDLFCNMLFVDDGIYTISAL